MKHKNLLSLFLLTTLLVNSCGEQHHELTVQDAWARPALKGQNGAVYFVIKNDTRSNDALIRASTDVADAAEAHMSMQNDQGVVSMQMQEAVQVPAGDDIAFEPGNLHIMLVDLNRDLKTGDVFILTLHFQSTGEIKLQVEVKEQ